MQIAIVMKGLSESTDHVIFANRDELFTIVEVFNGYCQANKRKQKAKKMLKQFDNELQIYL